MKKPSYVNTKTIHIIPVTILRPCWQSYDFHLEKESYIFLTSTLWRETFAKFTVQLKGHGILEHLHRPAPVKVPAPTLDHGSSRRHLLEPGHSSGYIGASGQINTPAQYGTFARDWTGTAYPSVREATTTSNARTYSTPSRQYSGYAPRPPRLNYDASRQHRSSIEQRSYNTVGGHGDQWSCLSIFVVIIFLLVVAWYVLHHQEPM
jgi:hypothetical protein